MNRIAKLLLLIAVLLQTGIRAQKAPGSNNPVYIDKQGVMRWTANEAEAAFFGVNYTTPFAYAYRAHKAIGADLEKAIRQDVYHMARLGFDAFRVHVWDTEISDSLGNLLDNEHLRLFDYLLAELKKRNIKTIITPIAFWGNGYPERDERTPGFSRVFGRGRLTTNDTAIKAQEHYLQQFFKHTNPYTKLSYGNDPDVIAVELNNEPSHSGPKSGVTNYINRLSDAVKSTGWTKPVFYNISQSPYYADAVAASAVNGFSFQWYPSGLVANQEQKGNFLPHVDTYHIPFDTIPAFANKALMVYEFDAADILPSYIYPAMARSFRGAGFQWATQFAYDPLAIAYANTEYQTHYLNLAYTPSKALSMLIASEVFHRVPREKNYGAYPADSLFDVFRLSYKGSLSEMNSSDKFYHSNTTQTPPTDLSRLAHVAGVGSSPVVQYNGSGAYFLDKLEDGAWRLELMPDAVFIRDPFERASPQKEVSRIQWNSNPIRLMLPGMGADFSIRGLNTGNSYSAIAAGDSFLVRPGTYLLVRKGKNITAPVKLGAIGMNEFEAPVSRSNDMFLQHEPLTEVSAGSSFTIAAKLVGIDSGRVMLQVSRAGGGQQRMIPMLRKTATDFAAEVPAEMLTPGLLTYRIILQKDNDYTVFPGNTKGNPFAWDNYHTATWSTFIADSKTRLEIFNPNTDRSTRVYPPFRRNFQTSYLTGEQPGQLLLRLAITELSGDHTIGFQHFFGDKLKGRHTELGSFSKIIIRARAGETQPLQAKVTLTDKNAVAVAGYITLTGELAAIVLSLKDMVPDSALLLPRPYPGFMPLRFSAGKSAVFNWADVEKIDITIGTDIPVSGFTKPYRMDIQSIWLEKAN